MLDESLGLMLHELMDIPLYLKYAYEKSIQKSTYLHEDCCGLNEFNPLFLVASQGRDTSHWGGFFAQASDMEDWNVQATNALHDSGCSNDEAHEFSEAYCQQIENLIDGAIQYETDLPPPSLIEVAGFTTPNSWSMPVPMFNTLRVGHWGFVDDKGIYPTAPHADGCLRAYGSKTATSFFRLPSYREVMIYQFYLPEGPGAYYAWCKKQKLAYSTGLALWLQRIRQKPNGVTPIKYMVSSEEHDFLGCAICKEQIPVVLDEESLGQEILAVMSK